MKKLFVFFLALMLAFGCVSTMPQYVRTPQQQAQINDAIVALVVPGNPELGLLFVECAGVFVDERHILTAAHCVDNQEVVNIVTYRDYTHTDHLLSEDIHVHRFVVERLDVEVDLALLVPVGSVPLHRILRVAEQAPTQGEYVVLTGHPHNLPWSLTQGVVSYAYRVGWGNQLPEDAPLYIQHDAASSPGNSGGVLLNHRNEIVGVLSQLWAHENHLSMSIHTSLINRFLYEE